jgi:uncharacterized membrane-anchored protein
MQDIARDGVNRRGSKVPAVAPGFWIVQIAATTLGETAGDAVSLKLGYAVGIGIFFALAQIRVRNFHPFLYWAVIVATAMTGTAMADVAGRWFGYISGPLMLFALLMAVLWMWWRIVGTVSVNVVEIPTAEAFYWTAILFCNALGAALGNFLADLGLGYDRGGGVFAGLLTITAAGYFFSSISRTALFWTAFTLSRPLGAMLCDLLTKPRADGGLAASRLNSSGLIVLFMIVAILLMSESPRAHPGGQPGLIRRD